MPFSEFRDEHAARLQVAFDGPGWRSVRKLGLTDPGRGELLHPPETENVFALPTAQLRAANEEKVRQLIGSGERDETRLLDALGTWPGSWPGDLPVRLSFLGLNVGYQCDMQPQCIYCNQQATEQSFDAAGLRRVIDDACAQDDKGPYIYITGGEPMLLGEDLYGATGLIATAARNGGACNLNTNALRLTPEVAVALVRAGLGRVHISLDTHLPRVQDDIQRGRGRWQRVIRGIHNLQIAKVALGTTHPVIHLNCVLTRLNAPHFPEFLRFVLSMKPLPSGERLAGDLDMHIIPVGGERNSAIRLSAAEYHSFFSETWDRANAVWIEHLATAGVEEAKRSALHEAVPFMSPYHRVSHSDSLEAWSERAASGRPADLAFARRCYVAPTQGFVLPDGSQYWCGGHTVSRPTPAGNVRSAPIRESIVRSIGHVAEFPGPDCRNCAGATLAINQIVEHQLRERVREMVKECEGGDLA